jgi:cytochrome c553
MKFRPTLVAFGLGIAAIGAAVSANAGGNADQGRLAAYTCHGCHGHPSYKNAYPNYSVPKLGGQTADYLLSALNGYANGSRPHQTMHSQAATLPEQTRADIALYLQSEVAQPNKEVVGSPPQAAATCAACHGADGAKPAGPSYPILAGQYADYIVQALKDYKSGRRKNPIMAGIVATLDESQFAALAQFFSRQRGLCSTDQILEHGKCVNR